MTERVLVVVLPMLYIGSFIVRNLMVKSRIQAKIRAADPLVTASIILTGSYILTTVLCTYSERWYLLMGSISALRSPGLAWAGFALFSVGFVAGWFVSAQLKASWRIGVHSNQKTDLIRNGVFAYVRNPYFLTYHMMFVGFFFVRPGFVLLVLLAAAIMVFHRMVLKEEAHLTALHGEIYSRYMRSTGRYLPRFGKKGI